MDFISYKVLILKTNMWMSNIHINPWSLLYRKKAYKNFVYIFIAKL